MTLFIFLAGAASGYIIGKLATTRRMNKELDSLMTTVHRIVNRPAVRPSALRS